MLADSISVKIMRSFDYCHFEVALSACSDGHGNPITVSSEIADDLRKQAARLVDKAVAQYKVAKANAAKVETREYERASDERRAKSIEAMAETDRSPEQQAELKKFKDTAWAQSREYDYQDDWDDNDY